MGPMQRNAAIAALSTLFILQIIMLAALFAGVPPHPPAETPLFGMGPFLGMSVSTAIAAIILLLSDSNLGRPLGIVAALMALVSFGPQKFFDPQFHLIWPAVITAQIAVVILALYTVSHLRKSEG